MTKVESSQYHGTRRGVSGHRLRVGVMCALLLAVVHTPSIWSAKATVTPAVANKPALVLAARYANFAKEKPSDDARHIADWVADSRDNMRVEFFIIDKKAARIYVFDADAQLKGSTAVLLGFAKGDDSAPGIGLKPLKAVKPEEKTTPAGRFVAERGRNKTGEDVIWIDYDAAVSMHRVRTTNAKERRLERLATATADDNRISYGCVNVPIAFYNTHIRPVFAKRRAIVYVLPDTKLAQQVFKSYDVAAKYNLPTK